MNNAEKRKAREARKAYLLSIPWIRELEKPVPCEDYRHSKISLKHIHSMGDRPPEGIPESARCKNKAHYRYTASRKRDDYGKTGNYCWPHTVSMLYADWHRYDEWRKDQKSDET